MRPASTEIAVIGAGVIGLTIARELALAGRRVTLVDPGPPGGGASHGNAGTIAGYGVMPVGSPEVLRDLPRLFFSRTSPLAIRHAGLPALAPWLMRFLRESLADRARRNAQALAGLLADATVRWIDLAAAIGGAELMQHRGALYLYETAAARKAAGEGLGRRRELGVRVELLDTGELQAMEPGLPPAAGGGAYFPDAAFLTDPGRMMALLEAAARQAGVEIVTARTETLTRGIDGVVVGGPGLKLHARRTVIAAGAHSRALACEAGDFVPLDTERGYHVEYDMAEPLLSRPVSPTSRGFYFCPMAGRLRVAGTVELGGLKAPPSGHRIARLDAGARAVLPGLGRPSRSWMGLRPSLPDSLPVIGLSPSGGEVIHAFGHGHLGLTLAPKTAAIVAALVAGTEPPADLRPIRPERFRRWRL